MEALASGTLVIAYPEGALPDVVTDERTDFLVHDVERMARAIGRLDRLGRRAAVARHLAPCEDLTKGTIGP